MISINITDEEKDDIIVRALGSAQAVGLTIADLQKFLNLFEGANRHPECIGNAVKFLCTRIEEKQKAKETPKHLYQDEFTLLRYESNSTRLYFPGVDEMSIYGQCALNSLTELQLTRIPWPSKREFDIGDKFRVTIDKVK